MSTMTTAAAAPARNSERLMAGPSELSGASRCAVRPLGGGVAAREQQVAVFHRRLDELRARGRLADVADAALAGDPGQLGARVTIDGQPHPAGRYRGEVGGGAG